MSQSQSQPQSQSQSRENEYGRQGLPPPPPPLQQYPPHLAYAHAGHQQRSGGDESANSNPNPYHHLQHGGGGGGGGANDDRSSPEQGSYSIIPQTRSRPTSPEGLSGSPDRKRYMGMDMNGRDNGENDPALGGQRTTPPDSGLYPGGGAQVDSGGGPVGGGLKNGGTASLKRSKASANSTATTTTIANGTGAGSVSSSGGGQQAPPLKRGNACNICRKRKLKCDGQRPVCGTCARLKHDCQYGDPAQERIAERHRQLEERIRSLEAELATYRNVEPRGGHPQSIPGLTIPHAPSEGAPPPAASGAAAVDPSLYFTAAAILPDPPLLNARGIKSEPSAGSSSANNNDNNSAAAPFPHFPTHELPVEPPFIFPSPVLSDSAVGAAAAAVPEGPTEASARRSASHGNGRRDRGYPASAADLHPSNYVSIPPPPPPHLQSFPFAMNPTPQLSDLVNPTTAASNGGGGGDPSSTRAGAPAPAGYNHAAAAAVAHHPYQGGQQQQQQTPYDAALTPIYGYDLPPLEIMLDLADIYFSTLHLHLPFLHRRRFLYTVHNSASLAAAPSQSLVFAVLAVAAAYHDNPTIRAQSVHWYAKARERVDFAISANVHPLSGNRAATLTVEMVQALCLLALIEMGQSDHQRAFLSLGQAVRIAAMLGLTRMDEDRVADRTGQMVEKRLRPPALHPLPDDAVLLEECRRTMCAVYVLDRFESATVGWPAAIAETDVRVLLPCPDDQFENGRCERDGRNNPLWWPSDGAGTDPAQGWEGVRAEFEAEEQHQGGGNDSYATNNKNGTDRARPHVPTVSTFAWLCRVVWLGSRIQCETYRASGPPPGGPWNRHVEMDPLGSPVESVEMDRVIEYIRSKLSDSVMREARLGGAIDGPKIMALLTLNCMITNLYHLRAASGLSRLPWDPSSPVNEIGSSEFAMQRCWQALHSQHEILSHLTQYENAHTSLHRSRLNAFTALVPYILYTIAFPAKFAIGDWNVLVQSRDRSENVPAHLARDDLPSGDDAFPPSYFERRLAIVDICCEAMDRIGEVWPVGRKFAAMIRGDRMRLAARTYSRAASAVGQQSSGAPSSSPLNSSQNGYGHAAQQPQA